MRKVFILLGCSVAFLLFVSACGNEKDDSTNVTDAAVELGEEFIHELYNVDDPELDYDDLSVESLIDAQKEFSAYFTEKEFEDLENKRFFLIPLEAASNQHNTISVLNIELKKYDRDDVESDALDFEHTFTLVFMDSEGNKVEEVAINGQMTVVDTEDGLKIDRYHESNFPMDMLSP